jgi:hypothetical protein
MEQWFYARDNNQMGPYAFEHVRALIASGALRAVDLVWKEGMPNWIPLHQVPDLACFLPPEPTAHVQPGPPVPLYPPPYNQGQYPPHRPQDRAEGDWDEDERLPRKRRKKKKRKKSVYDGTRTEKTWLERQFTETAPLMLFLFPLCCGLIAVWFGMIGMVACRDADARRNALSLLIISVVWIVVVNVIGFFLVLNGVIKLK